MLYYDFRRSLDNGCYRNSTTYKYSSKTVMTITANLIAQLELLAVLLEYVNLFLGLCFHKEIFSIEGSVNTSIVFIVPVK